MSQRKHFYRWLIVLGSVFLSGMFHLSFSFSDSSIIKNLSWRCIGPANPSGRISDFAVVENQPHIFYVGHSSGGLWKTMDNGISWESLFFNQKTSSLGGISLAPSDSNILWAGTGEPNNRQSSSWGNGVHKSTDGGKTWMNMGLQDSHHIYTIAIHPHDPNVVFVAALGRLWGPSEERGLFKTSDGGITWSPVLYIDANTGVVDVVIDGENPNIIFAATYQRQRRAWGFDGGGRGSGLHKSIDGGENWICLTDGSHGLPSGIIGRIGIDIYRRNSDIIYVIIEHENGGVFRSDNKGLNWEKMSDLNPRPMYYSKIRIDPNNDLRIWVLGVAIHLSLDGGKTWTTDRMSRFPRKDYRVHGDFHALWINPANSNHMIIGTDGGVYITHDGGENCEFLSHMPLVQFYEIGFDMRKPYYVAGGTQDNGTWHGPSAVWNRQSITNDDWYKIGLADGFYVQIDPRDHNTIYVTTQNGGLSRFNLQTFEAKEIGPQPEDSKRAVRFNWNSPVMISPHDPNTIFIGGNRLFISTDRGETWNSTVDLTKNLDREQLPLMGKLPDEHTLSKHDGVLHYGTITTMSESPLKRGVLYVGTDDGNIQISLNGGNAWTNVGANIPEIPSQIWVSRVIASNQEIGTAYASFDGHRDNDFKPYVFMTRDFGETWENISSDLPKDDVVRVIREHPRNPNLLFVGTERGAFFSINRGKNWIQFQNHFPTTPVSDIAIHPRDNDLIFGTHGNSIWILDDITPLEQLTDKILDSDIHLFDIRPATIYNRFSRWVNYDIKGPIGHKIFEGPNPPYGAIISYYLKNSVKDDEVKIVIIDGSGKKVRELQGPGEAGINRITWDLRHDYPASPPPAAPEWISGPSVTPGTYEVMLICQGAKIKKHVDVEIDPRAEVSLEDLTARRDLLAEIYMLNPIISDLLERLKKILIDLTSVKAAYLTTTQIIPQEIISFENQLKEIRDKTREISNLRSTARSIESVTEAPAEKQVVFVKEKTHEMKSIMDAMNKIIQFDIPKLNEMLIKDKIPLINPGAKIILEVR